LTEITRSPSGATVALWGTPPGMTAISPGESGVATILSLGGFIFIMLRNERNANR